jgi:hypothetical protein
VFVRPGVYSSPQTFVDGFTPALWVAVGFSALGMLAALLGAPRRRAEKVAPNLAVAEA